MPYATESSRQWFSWRERLQVQPDPAGRLTSRGRITTLILAAVAASCLAPAGSAAATLSSDGACVSRDANSGDAVQPVIHGTGFQVGALVRVTWADGQPAATALADVGGSFSVGGADGSQFVNEAMKVKAMETERWEHASELVATDGTATARLRMRWAIRWLDARGPARPAKRARIRFRVWGLPSGRIVYAHLNMAGRRIHTARLGMTQGACGDLRTRVPMRLAWEPWRWNVVVSDHPHITRADLEAGRFRVSNAVAGPAPRKRKPRGALERAGGSRRHLRRATTVGLRSGMIGRASGLSTSAALAWGQEISVARGAISAG